MKFNRKKPKEDEIWMKKKNILEMMSYKISIN